MRAKLTKISTNILRAIVSDVDPSIKDGTIELILFLKKGNEEVVSTLNYSFDKLDYEFDMSKKFPRNIVDFDYKIIVKNDSKQEETRRLKLYGNLPKHLSGAAKKIRNDFDIVSRNYNGSVAYFFKKLPGNERCPICWDEDLQSSNNSNCPSCNGTGKVRYFSSPFKTVCGPIKWQNEAFTIDNPGKVLASPTVSISALADLVLTTDDIIYYKATSEFYRVISRTPSELQGYAVLQTLVANLLPSNYTDAEICLKKLEEEGII